MTATTARKLVAAPVEADAIVPIELDGETPGRLPATFEIVPGALRLRGSDAARSVDVTCRAEPDGASSGGWPSGGLRRIGLVLGVARAR